MQLGPDARTRTPRQQAHRFAAVAQRHHEQSRAAILAALRVAHHRTTAVVDLRLFSWGGENDDGRFWKLGDSKLANEALHRLVASSKALIGDQILPDGHGIPATTESLLDHIAVRLAGTGGAMVANRR